MGMSIGVTTTYVHTRAAYYDFKCFNGLKDTVIVFMPTMDFRRNTLLVGYALNYCKVKNGDSANRMVGNY